MPAALLGAQVNIELLQRVKAKILEEPLQFAMEDFFTQEIFGFDAPREEIPNCGTAACIAGWAFALDVGKKPESLRARGYSTREARIRLDLTQTQAGRLFLLIRWPNVYSSRYITAKTPQEQAQIAAERIEHFIETEGRE